MGPSRITPLLAASLGLSPLGAAAQDRGDLGIEGRYVGERIFRSMDEGGRSTIHDGDIERFRDSAFAGMDSDGDRAVTCGEFAAWDPGFVFVAEKLGRKDAYTTASKIVFAFWDRDVDGVMTEREMRFTMSSDFRRADLDDDDLLTMDEFVGGFPIMVAMRAALRPDL